MHCMKRHIAAAAFSLLIAGPLLLIGGLQCWQLHLQQHWKKRLEQQAAQTLVVPAVAVVWQKRGKELNIDGRLFDVLSYRTEGASLIATGVFDEQETKLHTFLAAQHSRSPESFSIVQLLFVLQCFALFIKWALFRNSGILITSFFSPVSTAYLNPFATIATPPPRPHFYSYS
jgi:hypothetical protein